MKDYVQYGCGLSAPKEWTNFDASPTLRIQKKPILGSLLSRKMNAQFPDNVRYGDIVKGLPVGDNSCDGVYCSHVLEHLSFDDFQTAIRNTYRILKPNGFFRLVMPDLENMIDGYIENRAKGDREAAIKFVRYTGMAFEKRSAGMKSLLETVYGNHRHLWLWDSSSASLELEKAGFKNIRKCHFNDSSEAMFKFVESESRFQNAVALEMTK